MDRRVFIRQTAVAALGGLVAFDLSNALAKSEMAFMRTGTKYWTSSRNGGIMRYVLMLILI